MKHPDKHSKSYLERRYHHILKQLRISGHTTFSALRHLEQLLNDRHK